MSRPAPTRYRTLNWSADDAALRERGALTVWFDPAMVWKAAPWGERGRQQTFSDAAIQACRTIKGEGRPGDRPVACLSPERTEPRFGSPLRQRTGFVASLLKLAGLDWSAPFVGRSFHWKAR